MIKKAIDRIGAGWIFLIIMIAVYGVMGMMNYAMLQKALVGFWNILLSVLPVIALVFGFLFLTNLFMTPKRIIKYLGEESGIKGWVLMVVGGIISTGPIYMWYPLLKDLKQKGMKNSLIATFIYNRAIKIPLIPMMILYFGWVYTIILAIYMIVFSIINGIIVGRFTR